METNFDSNSTIASTSADKSLALAKPVDAPLTRAAGFLVITLSPRSENRAALRWFCGDLAALVRAVEFRDLEGSLSCVVGFAGRNPGNSLRTEACSLTTGPRSRCSSRKDE
jgi:hypothetical protein